MQYRNGQAGTDRVSRLIRGLVYLGAAMTFLSIFFIVVYLVVRGLPHMSVDLFAWKYTSSNVSLFPALVNTVLIAVLSLLIALPVGIGASIFLTEYARPDNPLVFVVRLATETLSGIPSIIYGLFGSLFFVKFLQLGLSIFSGALTLSIMVLPLIMRTTEEALLSVDESYRQGSFALGAGKLRTIFKLVLPSALPGIFSGLVLALGRIVGESAALIFTAGTVAEIASSLTDSSRTLAVHMYLISGEGMHINQTFATAFILLLVVIVLNSISEHTAKKLGSNHHE